MMAARQPTTEETQSFMSARASGDVDELLEALRKPAFRYLAAYALADLGERRAIPGLLRLLRANDRMIRIAAVRSLGRLRAVEAIDEICEIADSDPDALVREWAVYSIGLIGDPSNIRWLLAKTFDQNDKVSAVALAGLTSIDTPAARSAADERALDAGLWQKWRLRRMARRTSRRILVERSTRTQNGADEAR